MATLKVPWTTSGETTFEYKGRRITFSALTYNKVTGRLSTSISVGDRTFSGVAIVAGVDLLARFGTGLPPLYAYNVRVNTADPSTSTLLLVFEEAE